MGPLAKYEGDAICEKDYYKARDHLLDFGTWLTNVGQKQQIAIRGSPCHVQPQPSTNTGNLPPRVTCPPANKPSQATNLYMKNAWLMAAMFIL